MAALSAVDQREGTIRPVGAEVAPALLSPVATALDAPVELKDVLRLVADLTLTATDADRCSIFLLEGRQLHPGVAVCYPPSEELWTAFRAMPPIDLDPRWDPFAHGPVAVADVRGNTLIPQEWVSRFSIRSVAIVPLHSGDTPCGLMAVDRFDVRPFSDDELRALDELGAHAGRAIAKARPFESVRRRARLQEALARGAAALATPLEPEAVVRRLVRAYTELLGARVCGVALADLERLEMTTVATRNTRRIQGPIPLGEVPEHLYTLLSRTWASGKQPIVVGEDPWLEDFLGAEQAEVGWYLILPLLVDGHTTGGILLGFGQRHRLDAEERAAAEALAALGAAALERHALLERLARQLRQLDVLYHVSAELTEGADTRTLVAVLNTLLAGHGVEIVGVTFRDRALVRHLGGATPTPEERSMWRSGAAFLEHPDGYLVVPMRLGRRLVGTLRVQPTELDGEQRSFLEALATGLAEVASRGALRTAVEEAARDRAIANERERFAYDLHDTAGQLFIAIGLLTRRLVEQFPADSPFAAQAARVAELADKGKSEIDQAIRALAFVPAARRGLAPSLRALGRSFAADSGIAVEVEIEGRAARLPGEVERALYRVAHEALGNAWRHASCTTIRAGLAFLPSEVVLRIVDDGVGLRRRDAGEGRTGLTGMRRAVADVGGKLRVANGRPRGVVVEARVPREP
jgi:signal transduction histidine kinase